MNRPLVVRLANALRKLASEKRRARPRLRTDLYATVELTAYSSDVDPLGTMTAVYAPYIPRVLDRATGPGTDGAGDFPPCDEDCTVVEVGDDTDYPVREIVATYDLAPDPSAVCRHGTSEEEYCEKCDAEGDPCEGCGVLNGDPCKEDCECAAARRGEAEAVECEACAGGTGDYEGSNG